MSVDHSIRSESIKGVSFRFSFTLRYAMCSHRSDFNGYTQLIFYFIFLFLLFFLLNMGRLEPYPLVRR